MTCCYIGRTPHLKDLVSLSELHAQVPSGIALILLSGSIICISMTTITAAGSVVGQRWCCCIGAVHVYTFVYIHSQAGRA